MEDYKEKLRLAKEALDSGSYDKETIEYIFPELNESEDERIRSILVDFFKDYYKNTSMYFEDVDVQTIIAWLEKQGHDGKKWIYEDVYLEEKEQVFQDGIDEVLENPQRYGLEKQGEQNPSHNKKHIDYIKSIRKELLNIEDSVKNVKGLTESQWVAIRAAHRLLGEYLEKQGEQKPADKVEPKFRVKYAGNKYNVLEIKDIGGVTFYGIEDEPNHIDYVLPENCEIVSDYGYGVKEKGSPYPTKSAMFSEQHPAWSEEDEQMLQKIIQYIISLSEECEVDLNDKINWLNSLKERYTWKPSDEQMNTLEHYMRTLVCSKSKEILFGLYADLKKLREK